MVFERCSTAQKAWQVAVFKEKRTLNKVSENTERYGAGVWPGIWALRAAKVANPQLDALSSPLPPLATMKKDTLIVYTENIPAQADTVPDLQLVAEYLAPFPTDVPINFIKEERSQPDSDTGLLAPNAHMPAACEEDTHSVLDAPLFTQIPTDPRRDMHLRFRASEHAYGSYDSLGPHLSYYSHIPTDQHNDIQFADARFGGSGHDHNFFGSLGPHLTDYSQVPTGPFPSRDIEFARAHFDGSEHDHDFCDSLGPHLPDNFWLP